MTSPSSSDSPLPNLVLSPPKSRNSTTRTKSNSGGQTIPPPSTGKTNGPS
jgi:hypothetical protein